MRVVVGLGGNAIADRRGESGPAIMKQRLRAAASAIADIARDHETVITHGNGPQVGMLAMQGISRGSGPGNPHPLDVIGAESEGMIGYMLEREIAAVLPGSEIATLLTQVEVDPDDPAFENPQKPIGPHMSPLEAKALEERLGWQFRHDPQGCRRVVPSPAPKRIRELRTIELLIDAGVIVVCAGGGGVPVVPMEDGGLRGVEGVIDKDRTSALLAEAIHADALLLLTNVAAVYSDWPEPAERALRTAPPGIADQLSLDPGSMGPKLGAACEFVRQTGAEAMIGSLDEAGLVLQGLAGTRIRADQGAATYWSVQ